MYISYEITSTYLKFAPEIKEATILHLNYNISRFPLLFLLVMITSVCLHAQVMNSGFPNNNNGTNPQNGLNPNGTPVDSTKNKTTKNWKEEHAKIYFNYLNSAKAHQIDSSLEAFHRYQPLQPWWGADLGNYGSAVRNQFFTPFAPTGLSLGYHVYDMYQITLDSLRFYNTTRPYSSFQYLLGSKTEQNASILHTQNINPFWNFAFNIRYNSSPGFFKYQKANNLSGTFNTNYLSPNKRYYVAMGFILNKFKQNENGGIVDESQLTNSNYNNRSVVDVKYPGVNTTNASVNNSQRMIDFYIQNNYSFGKSDTLYNKDSTSMTLQFTPRFRIKHQLQLHGDKHTYNDDLQSNDSSRYATDHIANVTFPLTDSVYGVQKWFYVDNKFSLNGFIGKLKELVNIEAGIGNRIDYFQTDYIKGSDKQSSFGNYLFGEIKKEAFEKGQWEYQANANFFFTGEAVGNFNLNASVGKDLGKWGQFSGGFKQNLSNPAYTFTHFQTNYYGWNYSFDKTSITQIWAKTNIDKINVELGATNSVIANYIYYNQGNGDSIRPTQQSQAFSVLQIYGRKQFKFGVFRLDNELAWQQATNGAPVHLPSLLIRERIGIVSPLFKSACIVAAGLEAKYNTPYYSDGYMPYTNQFYLQNNIKNSNVPEVLAYFNFKIKTFRAFVMFDQLQQLVSQKNIILTPGYPSASFLFRFGFNWILIN